jgi:pantetheine-phosphate adenylyltransferase
MNSRIAVVPGSFDPPTLGHLDVIRRAASLYDELHVLVVHNPGKEAMLPIAQRLALLEQSIQESDIEGRVIIASWSMGLLVDYATDVGAGVLVKGIRSQIDVAYETPMAIVNRHLAHVETVFLLPDPAHSPPASPDRQLPPGDPVARSAGSMVPREKTQARTLQHQRARHRAPPR